MSPSFFQSIAGKMQCCNFQSCFAASTSRSVSTSDWNPQSLTALCSKGIQLLALSVWLSKTSDLSPEVMIALSNAKIWFSYRISPVTWLPTGPEVTKVEVVRMRSQWSFSKNVLYVLDVCLFVGYMACFFLGNFMRSTKSSEAQTCLLERTEAFKVQLLKFRQQRHHANGISPNCDTVGAQVTCPMGNKAFNSSSNFHVMEVFSSSKAAHAKYKDWHS